MDYLIDNNHFLTLCLALSYLLPRYSLMVHDLLALTATAPIITEGMARITALNAPATDNSWACLPLRTESTL